MPANYTKFLMFEIEHNCQVTRDRVQARQSSEKAEQSQGKSVSRSDPNSGAETVVSAREIHQHARSGSRRRVSCRAGETEEQMRGRGEGGDRESRT